MEGDNLEAEKLLNFLYQKSQYKFLLNVEEETGKDMMHHLSLENYDFCISIGPIHMLKAEKNSPHSGILNYNTDISTYTASKNEVVERLRGIIGIVLEFEENNEDAEWPLVAIKGIGYFNSFQNLLPEVDTAFDSKSREQFGSCRSLMQPSQYIPRTDFYITGWCGTDLLKHASKKPSKNAIKLVYS